MDMQINYPFSRIKTTNCPLCRLHTGKLAVKGTTVVHDADGKDQEHLRLVCDYCGYTLLFDLSVPRSVAFGGDEEEVLPS
jgi:predicted nucleic-acid-binding Zn-ribbon protein